VLKPDVVHVNGLGFPLPTMSLRRALPDCALVVQDHKDATASHPLRRAIARLGFSNADAVLFAAAPLARPWRERGLIAGNLPVDEVMESSTTFRALPKTTARQQTGVDGYPALLWVARLNANKDPLTVLDGVELAVRDLPELALTMVYQSGDYLERVKTRIATSAALRSRVRLIGAVPHQDLPAYFSAADLFVSGSHHEGSGYAVLEAIACGVVPVLTDIPTYRVMTANGRLGRLWPPGDARALALALEDMATIDRAPLEIALVEHFQRRLSWPAIGRAAMEVYRDVIRKKRAHSRSLLPVLVPGTQGATNENGERGTMNGERSS
jgi:glycosyltransferase involved in cell wall biosynthesis